MQIDNQDMGQSFQKLLSESFFLYKGLRFEKTSAGYTHNGILCRDFHEMDLLVESERHHLGNSIKNNTNEQ